MLPHRGRQQPVSLEEQQPTNKEKAASPRLSGRKTYASTSLFPALLQRGTVGKWWIMHHVPPPATQTATAGAKSSFLGKKQGKGFERKLEMDILKMNIFIRVKI